jgi:hypothetical protein
MTRITVQALFGPALRGNPLRLYHYADKPYTVLKTPEKLSGLNREDRSANMRDMATQHDPAPYHQHISFFLEPVPLDVVGRVFGSEHLFWYPGHQLYEHVVDLDRLPAFKYRLVETPLALQMYYSTPWEQLTAEQVLAYFAKLAQQQKHHGEIGEGVVQFKAAASGIVGHTREAFQMLPTRPNWDELQTKYAATVPHVLLYPHGGEIKPTQVNAVKVERARASTMNLM